MAVLANFVENLMYLKMITINPFSNVTEKFWLQLKISYWKIKFRAEELFR